MVGSVGSLQQIAQLVEVRYAGNQLRITVNDNRIEAVVFNVGFACVSGFCARSTEI